MVNKGRGFVERSLRAIAPIGSSLRVDDSASPRTEVSSLARGKARERRIALSASTEAISRVVSVLTGLITVPLTISYLGTEEYGLWMTISAAIGFFVFADLGIGSGVLNAVARS